MDFIEGLQTTFGDAFITLPLLLIGVSFFFGTMTSNTGLLYLFLGQLLIVPAITFTLNETGRPWKEINNPLKNDYVRLIRYIISLATTLGLNAVPYDGSLMQWMRMGISFPMLVLQYLINTISPQPTQGSPNCSVVPRTDPQKTQIYSSPSSWVSHISFFFAFVFSNALAIFNEPVPELQNVKEKDRASRQSKLDERVQNRKIITGAIMALSIVLLLVFLFFRYVYTPCESGFMRSIPGILLAAVSGGSFYEFIYAYCGVRPADVLGIVNGLVSPDLIDNPIVCVGE
jgi:hypothetical protein